MHFIGTAPVTQPPSAGAPPAAASPHHHTGDPSTEGGTASTGVYPGPGCWQGLGSARGLPGLLEWPQQGAWPLPSRRVQGHTEATHPAFTTLWPQSSSESREEMHRSWRPGAGDSWGHPAGQPGARRSLLATELLPRAWSLLWARLQDGCLQSCPGTPALLGWRHRAARARSRAGASVVAGTRSPSSCGG